MQFSVLVHLLNIFAFLFCLYLLSKDDFMLFRKNVSLDKVFDLAFLTIGIGILSARIGFVIFNFNYHFLNPLYFFLFPYFPGLSIAGGIIGSFLFLFIYCLNSKISFHRIFDFFAFSFLFALPFGFVIEIFNSLISKKTIVTILYLEILIYFISFLGIYIIFKKIKLEDGSLGFLSLMFFSILSFIFNIGGQWKKISFLNENLLLLVIFLISSFFIVKEEKLYLKIRKINFKKIKAINLKFWKRK
ncbi:hypothetical protein C4559_04940 [Candidatus Microgenomates bacterium]|nr:MAG: hypothetical protein C4559_04940 [Candidatus Microgenomates bacterium]